MFLFRAKDYVEIKHKLNFHHVTQKSQFSNDKNLIFLEKNEEMIHDTILHSLAHKIFEKNIDIHYFGLIHRS